MVAPSGILLIDKPSGVTSFQVVNHVRKQLVAHVPGLSQRRAKTKGGPRPPRFKCGHAGTLDPLATGLLVVLVGKGSRLSPFLMGLEKSYAATVRFGASTDTLDREGEVVGQAPVPADPATVSEVLPRFRGDIQQVPPLISALKKDGKALYKRVRAGEDVAEPEARPVKIERLELVETRWPAVRDGQEVFEMDLEVACSSGTYIRSLARDIAQAVGSEGYIQELRRLSIDVFDVEDTHPGVMQMSGAQLLAKMLPLADALPQTPVLPLDDEQTALVRQGGQPQLQWLDALTAPPVAVGKSGRLFRMVDPHEQLVAVGKIDDEDDTPRIAAVFPLEVSPDNEREEPCD